MGHYWHSTTVCIDVAYRKDTRFLFDTLVISVCVGSEALQNMGHLCAKSQQAQENSKIHIQLVNGEAMVPCTDMKITFIPVILLFLNLKD